MSRMHYPKHVRHSTDLEYWFMFQLSEQKQKQYQP